MSRNKHIVNVLEPFSAPYATHEERAAYAAGLRGLADWIEQTRFPIPSLCFRRVYGEQVLDVPSLWIDDEGFVKRAGSAARLIGGKVNKGTVDFSSEFKLERDFGGGVKFRYRIARDAVCEAVEVTEPQERYVPTDEEEAERIKAQIEELQKQAAELPHEKKIVSVTRTEYVCPDSLIVKETQSETTEREEIAS